MSARPALDALKGLLRAASAGMSWMWVIRAHRALNGAKKGDLA